jgi:hypothetical protein
VAAKALARQSDVNQTSVKVEKGDMDVGRVVFAARPGHSLDLEKIHAALKETRLSGKPPGRTRARIHYLELTVLGEVVKDGKDLVIKVNGTKQVFRLGEGPEPADDAPAETGFQRLQKALAKGQKVVGVTGRVKGWKGHFPAVLRDLPGDFAPSPKGPGKPPLRRPPLLYVVGFDLSKK